MSDMPDRFPVLNWAARANRDAGCPHDVPWAMLAPHYSQAEHNHAQSLQRLAARGGLDPVEMLCVLDGTDWEGRNAQYNDPAYAVAELQRRVASWAAGHPTKIPANCRECGETLTRGEMRSYLDMCETAGRAPSPGKDGKGIMCARCLWRTLSEMGAP